MINHPMAGLGVDSHGDFSVTDIEDAVGGAGDRDYPAFYEAAGDFGTLGEPAIYDSSLYGDDNDLDGMGRKRWKKKFKIKKPNLKKLGRVTVPSLSAARKIMPKKVQAIINKPSGLSKKFRKNKFGKIGNKIGLASLARPKIAVPSVAAAIATIPAVVAARQAIPTKSAPRETVPQINTPMISTPSVTQEQVVSTGGQISQQKIDAASTRAAVQTAVSSQARARRFAVAREHAHPMLAFSNTMGEGEEMGFDLKSLFSDAKKKAQEELNKLKAKAEADLKARAGQALSNVSASILQKPQVQAAIADQAKQGVAQTVAEKLLDPEVQKKAAIGGVTALAVLGGLAYLAFKKD